MHKDISYFIPPQLAEHSASCVDHCDQIGHDKLLQGTTSLVRCDEFPVILDVDVVKVVVKII